jgi:hypothetical protein
MNAQPAHFIALICSWNTAIDTASVTPWYTTILRLKRRNTDKADLRFHEVFPEGAMTFHQAKAP